MVRRDDVAVALDAHALEFRNEGPVAEFEEPPVVSENLVNPLVLTCQRVVARRDVNGVGGEQRRRVSRSPSPKAL
jgi:hypothetical protein